LERAEKEGEEAWWLPADKAAWMIPSEPRVCLCAGRNYHAHKADSIKDWGSRGVTSIHSDFPTGFSKLPTVLVPHNSKVVRPPDVEKFDYEVEIAAIIGKTIERVKPEHALDAVFGYTVFNDLSAREWQQQEMRNQQILIGKNFPGFGPIGPWILTADEMPNPQVMTVILRVNGQERQRAPGEDMVFSISELVSFWSRMGLGVGDVIAAGTPGGVALHHKPDPFEWYLKPGDVVEAEVDAIGVLKTSIAASPAAA